MKHLNVGTNLWQEAQVEQLKRECEEEIASKIKEKDCQIRRTLRWGACALVQGVCLSKRWTP